MFKTFAFAILVAAVAALPQSPSIYNIHPVIDDSKCIGIVGGVYSDGAQVDVFVPFPHLSPLTSLQLRLQQLDYPNVAMGRSRLQLAYLLRLDKRGTVLFGRW